jgi:hypothetical protein
MRTLPESKSGDAGVHANVDVRAAWDRLMRLIYVCRSGGWGEDLR